MNIFNNKNVKNVTNNMKQLFFGNEPTNNKKNKSDTLNIISWNVEDFCRIEEIINNRSLIFNLRQQHILLIQEWNDKNYEGQKFVFELEDFAYVYTDRVAVLYNKNRFDRSKTKVFDIKLEYEKPTLLEKVYTSGRQKSNILTILYPYQDGYNPLCIISFHLSAFIPTQHPGFHKKQLTNLIKKAIEIMESLQIESYDMIIGGDTNYRITKHTINKINLKNELINNINLKKKLKNVCNKKCQNKYTQSFSCVHEKSSDKKLISSMSYFFNKTKLDLMLTNLNVINAKIDHNLCNISDHSMILAQLEYDTLSKENNES
jgi:hypothetical protein